MKKQTQQKLTVIKEYNNSYYNGTPQVDDITYDLIRKELEVEMKLEGYSQEDIDKEIGIGSTPTSIATHFEKAEHEIKMLSLQNTFNLEELEKFMKSTGINEWYVEPKIDGVSIELIYNNGKLIKALTRGDGLIGEDVTNNVKQINDIPKTINYTGKLIVRGEIYLPLSMFEYINSKSTKQYANARNLASGTLRQLDSKVVKERGLSTFIYWINTGNDIVANTQEEIFTFLDNNNFPTIINKTKNTFKQQVITVNDIKEIVEDYQRIKDEKAIEFDIDGIVFKVNALEEQAKLGNTIKYPKWATSFKFRPDMEETILIDIVPTVGRTGMITYNAILEPVVINGTTVSKASLHNKDIINNLGLRIGAKVLIKKAGEIIPQVVSVIKDEYYHTLKPWNVHTNCPHCDSVLGLTESGIDQVCNNPYCPAKKVNDIIFFSSKKALDIIGLGDKVIKTLFDNNIIKEPIDIFNLKNKKEEMMRLEGFADKSFNKLIDNIEKAKEKPLHKVFIALGINNIGNSASIVLFKHFKTVEYLLLTSKEELIDLEDFGDTKVDALYDWIQNDSEIINQLKAIGFTLKNNLYKEESESNASYELFSGYDLVDKSIVITGSFEGFNRETIAIHFETKYGAIVKKGVSSKTDYLICGENPSGSKLNKIDDNKILWFYNN